MEEKRITINVSGTHYEISETTMDRLMQLNSHAGQVILEQKKENKQVFYFERHPGIFMAILGHLQGRALHLPTGVCVREFTEELEFWGIDQKYISKCCFSKIVTFNDDLDMLRILDEDKNVKEKTKNELQSRIEGKQSWQRRQAIGWLILEEPSTSKLAKVSRLLSPIPSKI